MKLKHILAGLAVTIAAGAYAQTKWDLPAAYPTNNNHTKNHKQNTKNNNKQTKHKQNKTTAKKNGIDLVGDTDQQIVAVMP